MGYMADPESTRWDRTAEDVAEQYGVSRRTVYNWMNRGADPLPHRRIGGVLRFNPEETDAWARRRTEQGEEEET